MLYSRSTASETFTYPESHVRAAHIREDARHTEFLDISGPSGCDMCDAERQDLFDDYGSKHIHVKKSGSPSCFVGTFTSVR